MNRVHYTIYWGLAINFIGELYTELNIFIMYTMDQVPICALQYNLFFPISAQFYIISKIFYVHLNNRTLYLEHFHRNKSRKETIKITTKKNYSLRLRTTLYSLNDILCMKKKFKMAPPWYFT